MNLKIALIPLFCILLHTESVALEGEWEKLLETSVAFNTREDHAMERYLFRVYSVFATSASAKTFEDWLVEASHVGVATQSEGTTEHGLKWCEICVYDDIMVGKRLPVHALIVHLEEREANAPGLKIAVSLSVSTKIPLDQIRGGDGAYQAAGLAGRSLNLVAAHKACRGFLLRKCKIECFRFKDRNPEFPADPDDDALMFGVHLSMQCSSGINRRTFDYSYYAASGLSDRVGGGVVKPASASVFAHDVIRSRVYSSEREIKYSEIYEESEGMTIFPSPKR